MSARASRIAYGLTLAALAVLLYFFGSPIVLLAIVLLLVLAAVMGLSLRKTRISLCCTSRSSGLAGREERLQFMASRTGTLLSAACVYMQICIRNSMTGEERHRTLALPLWGKGESFTLKLVPESCGELVITCEKAWVQDHLKLFSRSLPPFDPVRVTIYPANVGLEVILDRQDVGRNREDGPMLNRPGTDKSETFDVRDYRPGDDVRAIHWKLSVKEDKPIVRIPGSPGFFDMVVLADFGKVQQGQPIAPERRNAALAYGSAVLQQMVRKGVRCCLALPEVDRITLLSMENRQDYRQAMARWMATPLPANTGDAMRLFRLEHLENRFARLLLLSVDGLTDEQELHGSTMAITVLSTVENGSEQTREVGSIRVTELPAKPDRERVYRLYC